MTEGSFLLEVLLSLLGSSTDYPVNGADRRDVHLIADSLC